MEKRNISEKGVANNQISCHGKLDLESSTLAVLESKTINDLRGRSRIKYGMTSLFNNGGFTSSPSSPRKVGMRGIGAVTHLYPALRHCGMTKCVAYGFTLIELLVVVLIIGILAAVAVPQYQKAVYKSRTAEAMNMLRAIHEAQEVYYLANQEYTTELEKLDVQPPSDQIITSTDDLEERLAANPDRYHYRCTAVTCFANAGNSGMPTLEYNMNYAPTWKGNFWCLGTKTDMAKSVCASLGTLSTLSDADWFKGKYFKLN